MGDECSEIGRKKQESLYTPAILKHGFWKKRSETKSTNKISIQLNSISHLITDNYQDQSFERAFPPSFTFLWNSFPAAVCYHEVASLHAMLCSLPHGCDSQRNLRRGSCRTLWRTFRSLPPGNCYILFHSSSAPCLEVSCIETLPDMKLHHRNMYK